MVLLVDGYNVIKYLLPHDRHEHDGQRDWLLGRLSKYMRAKSSEIQEVIVVFDGGLLQHRHREVHRGVAIIFAGHRRSADDVLVDYAERYQGGAVLITNDRELARRSQVHGAQVVSVSDFDSLCSQVLQGSSESGTQRYGSVCIKKLTDEENSELDDLMRSGSIAGGGVVYDEESECRLSSGRRKKKKERSRERLKEKLGLG